MKKQTAPLLCLVLLLLVSMTLAQEQPPQDKPGFSASAPVLSVTRHTVKIDGQTVPYTATVGELVVAKPDEKPGAKVFFTAYTRDDVKDVAARPVTFAYNGGPGSSSVWLHLGGIGPRRVRLADDGSSTPPPFGLEENPDTLLDVTDLVFVDPVSTGFSRPLPGENKNQFHGISEDIASVGEFIRLYITRFGRWASPKFLLGESYGTFRSAGLSGYLQNRQNGMYLNGIVLVSSVLDFQTILFSAYNNLTYILFLPHYAATAWFHKRLSSDLQSKPLEELLDEVERFAERDYSEALFQGNRLSAEEYGEAARKLAAYTGLSEDYIRQSNLRVRHDRFVKQLLRDEARTVGRLDSRFLGRDTDAAGENYEFDPSSANILGAFSAMFNDYVRGELNFDRDGAYHVYGNVYPWNFTPTGEERMRFGGGLANTAEILERAMRENPFLEVFVANGYYDGATPYFGTEFTFAQMGLSGEFGKRVHMGYYEAGHMMYIDKASLAKLKRDVSEFIRSASGR